MEKKFQIIRGGWKIMSNYIKMCLYEMIDSVPSKESVGKLK